MKITSIVPILNHASGRFVFSVILMDHGEGFTVQCSAENLVDYNSFVTEILAKTGRLYNRGGNDNWHEEIRSHLFLFWCPKKEEMTVKDELVKPVPPEKKIGRQFKKVDVWNDLDEK